jgi:hypothetical protein
MDELKITLDGSDVTLVPSLMAAKKLSEKYSGLLPLMDVINIGSLAAATDVLFYALAKKDSERAALEDQTYAAGLKYLAPHLCTYVIALMNGGKLPRKADA